MKKIKYRLKKGYGKHYAHRKMYQAGDVIIATADELRGAMDKFEPLEETPSPPEPETGLFIKKVKGGYNVINGASGKKLNDEPLHKDAADAMALESEGADVDPDETKDNESDGT